MSQAATFGRRAPIAAAPAPRSAKPRAAAAPTWSAGAEQATRTAKAATRPSPGSAADDRRYCAPAAFDSSEGELESWKSERRARLLEAMGPWRWLALASASGALTLLISGYDPGHIAKFLTMAGIACSGMGGQRVREYLRLRAEGLA